MTVSIIIVNYKSPGILKKSIESLFKHEDSSSFEVIIVDNFSQDDSKVVIDKITGSYKNVKAIFLDKRQSFSRANNCGFGDSAGEFVLIQNPDIIYTSPVLSDLTGRMKASKEIGAISPMLVGTDNKFQRNYFLRYPTLTQFILFYSIYGKFFYRFPKLLNRYLENQEIEKSKNEIVQVKQIPCAFFLTSREVFIQAGKMDERYELFFEDVDLSYQVNKFKKLAVDTKLSVIHLGGVSFQTEDNWWMFGRFIYSMYCFTKKNYSGLKAGLLKFLCLYNSYFIIVLENMKKVFGKQNEYRIKKHKYLINIFKNFK